MTKHLIVLLISLISFNSSIYSVSKLEFERLNTNNGLSSDEIRSVFQSSDGFIWFLTKNGLNRYDGYDVKVFKNGVDGLYFASNSFECICQDNQQNIWLGTQDKGIIVFNTKQNKTFSFEEISHGKSLADSHIRTLHKDKKGNIWIGTEYGLFSYNITTTDLQYFNLGNLNSSTPSWCIVESFMEDSKGNIWIGTWTNGLFIIDNSTGDITNHNIFNKNNTTINDNRIKAIFEDSFANIWIGTWEDGLYEVERNKNGLVIERYFLYNENSEHTIAGDIIYSINQDDNYNLWVGTPYGLTIIENLYSKDIKFNNQSYNYGAKSGLSNNEVWKIYRDKSGLMWLGTLEGGVNKVHPKGKKFESFNIPPVSTQIFSQTVKSFCYTKNNKLLIGVKSLGFGEYDLTKKKYTPYYEIEIYNSLPRNINTVNCFAIEENGNIWLGTRYNGLILFNNNSLSYTLLNQHIFGFNYESVNSLQIDPNGNIWVGTDAGLLMIKHQNFDENPYEYVFIDKLIGYKITSIVMDEQSSVWVGTENNGVFKISDLEKPNSDILTLNTQNNRTPSNHIQYIYCDAKSNIWTGTSDLGLLYFNDLDSTFHNQNIFKGTLTDAVYAIIEDTLNNLWLTTNNGLTRVINTDGNMTSDSYSTSDGLLGNIFVPGSIFKDSRGIIYVGTYYGFNRFNPVDITLNDFEPITQITDFKVSNTTYYYDSDISKMIVLTHDQNKLSFEFSAMSYYKPDKNRYAYKLIGFNNDWQYTDANSRRAEFTNLQAGEYTFMVKSANSSELWNQRPVSIQVKILPAPYQTWWAYLLYTVVFILIFIMIYRIIIKNERIKRAFEIEKIEYVKSEKLNQFKLKFFTNISHELLTPLSIIMCSLDIIKSKTRKNKEEFTIVDRNISQLNRLLHQLLDFRKMESGHLKLKVGKTSLLNHIESIVENFKPLANQNNITINLQQSGDYNQSYFDSDKVDKILDNLIANAIKYTYSGGSILISTELEKKDTDILANISVVDTGKGIAKDEIDKIFNRFYRSGSEDEDTGTGIGLAFTKNLVELHKGTITVSSELGKGSNFSVSIPVNKSAYTKTEISSKYIIPDESISGSSKVSLNQLAPSQISLIKKADITLMLVDDNRDFRSVLKSHFKKVFKIIEASNGKEALLKAIELQPDIIISDVLMPVKDGIELCLELKTNIDTKFIPVILLSAETAEEQRTLGYKAGADSYISKPISIPVLESRINSLLLKRNEQLPLLLSEKVHSDLKYKMPDHLFIKEIEKYVLNNLEESSLSVKSVGTHFALSDSMLLRRIKKITSLSPIEYINKLRLNQAAKSLKKGDVPIADVAFATGFQDQSYFTSCFKKQFGITPSKYLQTNGNKFTG